MGGGTGTYAFWLVDLVPRHIAIAAAQRTMHGPALTSMTVGDARHLAFSDQSADVVDLAGPLYHLIEREERIRALRESHRVLREGGVMLSVAINRYAGVIYGLTQGLVFERDYFDMTVRELSTGVRNDPPSLSKDRRWWRTSHRSPRDRNPRRFCSSEWSRRSRRGGGRRPGGPPHGGRRTGANGGV